MLPRTPPQLLNTIHLLDWEILIARNYSSMPWEGSLWATSASDTVLMLFLKDLFLTTVVSWRSALAQQDSYNATSSAAQTDFPRSFSL